MKKVIIPAIIGLVAIAAWVRSRDAGTPVTETKPAVVESLPSPLPSFAATEAEEAPNASPSPRAKAKVAGPEKSVVASAPSIASIRDEVEKNPHTTPPSLLDFAAGLAPKMEAAQKSPEAAVKFAAELEDCVTSPKLAATRNIQALCVVNLRRLGDAVPAVKARTTAAAAKADPEAQRLAK